MAKKVIFALVDDVDGESVADETIEFSIDGVSYEIDLSRANVEKLRAGLEPWISKARKVGGRQRKPKAATATAPRGKKAAVDREQTAATREWARKNGYNVSSRGRIPSEIAAAYHNAAAKATVNA
jgi:hypothetical protein